MSGRRREAEQILDELLSKAGQRYLPSFFIAQVYVGLGETDAALEWLEKSYDARFFLMTWLNGDPQFDSLRSDPRFGELLRRIGL